MGWPSRCRCRPTSPTRGSLFAETALAIDEYLYLQTAWKAADCLPARHGVLDNTGIVAGHDVAQQRKQFTRRMIKGEHHGPSGGDRGLCSDLVQWWRFTGYERPAAPFVRLGLNRYKRPVLGIRDGYRGLVSTCQQLREGRLQLVGLTSQLPVFRHGGDDDGVHLVRFDHRSVAGITARGGIVLGSSRCPEFVQPTPRQEAIELLKSLDVEALLVCGGDGSTKGAALVAQEAGLQVLVVPGSIDNDVSYSDLTLGFDTAVNTVIDCAQKFTDTAGSHHRIMVLEIMGRNCGQLAVAAALASGTEIVVAPERGALSHDKMQGVAERIETSMKRGRRHAIVMVGEGVPLDNGQHGSPAKLLADYLEGYFHRCGSPFPQVDTRASVLGHVQRGGSPTASWPPGSRKRLGPKSDAILQIDAAECSASADARSSCTHLIRPWPVIPTTSSVCTNCRRI